MDKNPVISVIVPIYNVSKYLDDCLTSIRDQEYNNLEIILVDDGSTDNSFDIAKRYAENDNRFHIYQKDNGGLSSARNYGIQKATGKYLVFVDSDDFLDRHYILELYSAIVKDDSDVCICGYKEYDPSNINKVFNCEYSTESNYELIDKNELWNRFYFSNHMILPYIVAWTKIYKKELFDTISFDEGCLFEDELLSHRLFHLCNKISLINKCLYFYRKNRFESISSSFNGDLIERNMYMFKRARFFVENNYDVAITLKACAKCITLYSNNYYLSLVHKEIADDYRVVRRFYIENSKMNPKFFLRLYLPSIALFFSTFIRKKYGFLEKIKKGLIIKKYKNHNLIIGTPTHGNLGDQAIAETISKLVDKSFCEVDIDTFFKYKKTFYKFQPTKIILLGGGNMGNLYPIEEELRLSVIENYSDSKIIIFPQTICFEESFNKEYFIDSMINVYSKHKKLYIFAREKQSYLAMKKLFPYNNIFLTPDIVLFNNPIEKHVFKKQVLILKRRDKEESLDSANSINHFKSELIKKGYEVIEGNTVVEKMLNSYTRKKEIDKLLKSISVSSFVITDRLHGMIFSYITSTPAIVFDNNNHKILGCHEWLKDVKYIRMCDNDFVFEEFLKSTSGNNNRYDSLKKQFSPLLEVLKQ